MQSFPTFKHCFDLVASLSKKLLTNVLPSSNPSPSSNSLNKSLPKHQDSIRPESQGKDLPAHQPQSSSAHKAEQPKIICFETYLQNGSHPLKSPSFKGNSGAINHHQKTIELVQDRKIKIQQPRTTDNLHKNYPQKKIENRYSNLVRPKHQSATQKPYQNNRNTYPPTKRFAKGVDNQGDDQLSSDEVGAISKKTQKMIKKQQKNTSVAECLDINTDDMIFTYDDGDDISSIEAKSETTDEIEPQLLSFINKRNMMNNFYKSQDQKLNNFPHANMKKKPSHYQGETVPRRNANFPSPKQEKKPQPEPASRQKTKKRAFQLYPGETFEQFKKRILIQNKSSSSENSDEENYFPGKLIKKQQYERILSQLNSSMSRMDEQKNKQVSILVIQKMVDESENQQSENCFKRQQPILENIENYKVWDNQGDNASFRLYYRDS